MKKITKKEGQLHLMENISKLVLTGYVNLNKANELLDMENKKFIELTKDIACRHVIKYNNITFRVQKVPLPWDDYMIVFMSKEAVSLD